MSDRPALPNVPESDEVLGQKYRLAQATRLLRYYRERGYIDADGRFLSPLPDDDLAAILDEDGRVVPEREDVDAVEAEASRQMESGGSEG